MTEQFGYANGFDLCYETIGEPGGRPLMLIMGLGSQFIWWHDDFCAALASRGFYVVRFDNRDVGRSGRAKGRASLAKAVAFGRSPYSLSDMAADAVGLLDYLEIEAAHVVGVSLGGMITQTIAIEHPTRVRSITSIMSTTGSRLVGHPSPGAVRDLMRPLGSGREAYVDRITESYRSLYGPVFPFEEERVRQTAGRAYDRGISPGGVMRQLAAAAASPDRTSKLKRLSVPALVIHGDKDPLINVSGGKATAKAIPGAELDVVAGMGHALPSGLFERFVDAIERTADRADAVTKST